MSYNFFLIAIDGDQRSQVANWLAAAGYEVAEAEDDGVAPLRLRVGLVDGRTIIDGIDLLFDESELGQISTESGGRVIEIMCAGTADAYGFRCHDVESEPPNCLA